MSFKKLALTCLFLFVSSCAITPQLAQQDTDEIIYLNPDLTRQPSGDSVEQLEKVKVSKGAVTYIDQGPQNETPVAAKACGYLYGTEDNRNALNSQDAFYILEVDCKSVNGRNESVVSQLRSSVMLPQQRGYISRWREAAVKASLIGKNIKAGVARKTVPYLCFEGQVGQSLCQGEKTNRILKTDRMTSLTKTFESWK